MNGPDEARMLAWLRDEAVRADGAVLSWVNPARPGYAYPEVAGLWLTVMAGDPEVSDAEIERVAAWLIAQVDASGRVGRHEVRYSFDSAIAVIGLCQARRRGLATDPRLLARMGLTLADDLRAREVAFPAGPARWSTRASAHVGKLRWAFTELDATIGPDPDRAHAELDRRLAAIDDEVCLADGRIRIRPDDDRSYVHASCYALEGMLRAAHGPRGLEPGARWLTTIQRPDGSLPNWVSAPDETVAWPSDIVAQAARIWARVDPVEFATPIALALAQLRARQTASGGLSYLPRGSREPDDINVWATLFAVQAVRWASGRDMSMAIA